MPQPLPPGGRDPGTGVIDRSVVIVHRRDNGHWEPPIAAPGGRSAAEPSHPATERAAQRRQAGPEERTGLQVAALTVGRGAASRPSEDGTARARWVALSTVPAGDRPTGRP
jgi:hypothetical protein